MLAYIYIYIYRERERAAKLDCVHSMYACSMVGQNGLVCDRPIGKSHLVRD